MFDAIIRGQMARAQGKTRHRVFDWNKAAKILAEHRPDNAEAGLAGDMGWTGGSIWSNGTIDRDGYTYLSSIWAIPILCFDGEEIECWAWEEELPGWDSDTKWPDSAVAIITAAAEKA